VYRIARSRASVVPFFVVRRRVRYPKSVVRACEAETPAVAGAAEAAEAVPTTVPPPRTARARTPVTAVVQKRLRVLFIAVIPFVRPRLRAGQP
jgi:hypothetical protein